MPLLGPAGVPRVEQVTQGYQYLQRQPEAKEDGGGSDKGAVVGGTTRGRRPPQAELLTHALEESGQPIGLLNYFDKPEAVFAWTRPLGFRVSQIWGRGGAASGRGCTRSR